MSTKIEWADKSWNPVTGCSPISEGCRNCYAARMAKRLAGRYGYPKNDPFKVTFHKDKLHRPKNWSSRRVFVCSMADLFHNDVTDDQIQSVFDVMYRYRHHTYIVLTKRIGRLVAMTDDIIKRHEIYSLSNWQQNCFPVNIWIGVSAENQQTADQRIPALLDIPAKIRFVFFEPLLGPIYDPWTCEHMDWVIVGAETGPGARVMNMDWVNDIKDGCQRLGIPYFLKKRRRAMNRDLRC